MADPIDSLPDGVVEAWKGGNRIEAIRRLREATHMGLAEAKAVIDALDRAIDESLPAAPASPRLVSGPALPEMMKALLESGALPPDVMEAWQRGSKIEALKRFAAAAKEGRIQNVKVQVKVNERRLKSGTAAARTDASTPATPARTPMPDNGLAPGEVPRSKGGATAALVLLALVVIALLIYARYG